jgi:hypothetical protein
LFWSEAKNSQPEPALNSILTPSTGRQVANSVLLRGIQLMFVQRFQQQYFVIHYCCDNTREVRAPNAVRRSEAPLMYSIGLI